MAKRSGYSQQYFAARRAAMRNGNFVGGARPYARPSRGQTGTLTGEFGQPKPRQVRAKRPANAQMVRVDGIAVPVPQGMRKATLDRIRALPPGEQGIAVDAALKAQKRAAAHHARRLAAAAANGGAGAAGGTTTAAPPAAPPRNQAPTEAPPRENTPNASLPGLQEPSFSEPVTDGIQVGRDFIPRNAMYFNSAGDFKDLAPNYNFATRPRFERGGLTDEGITNHLAPGKKFQSTGHGLRELAERMGANVSSVTMSHIDGDDDSAAGFFNPMNRSVTINNIISSHLENALTDGDYTSTLRRRQGVNAVIHEFIHAKDPVFASLDNDRIKEINAFEAFPKAKETLTEGTVEYQARRTFNKMTGGDAPTGAYDDATRAIGLLDRYGGPDALDAVWSKTSINERAKEYNTRFSGIVKDTMTGLGYKPQAVDKFNRSIANKWDRISNEHSSAIADLLNSGKSWGEHRASGKRVSFSFKMRFENAFNDIVAHYGDPFDRLK
jgi:hypothetical protein